MSFKIKLVGTGIHILKRSQDRVACSFCDLPRSKTGLFYCKKFKKFSCPSCHGKLAALHHYFGECHHYPITQVMDRPEEVKE